MIVNGKPWMPSVEYTQGQREFQSSRNILQGIEAMYNMSEETGTSRTVNRLENNNKTVDMVEFQGVWEIGPDGHVRRIR